MVSCFTTVVSARENSIGDLEVEKTSDVMDRHVFHSPDRFQSQERLPAQGSIVGGDDLQRAGVGLTDERDTAGTQPDHALRGTQFRMNLTNEPVSPERAVMKLDHLPTLDLLG